MQPSATSSTSLSHLTRDQAKLGTILNQNNAAWYTASDWHCALSQLGAEASHPQQRYEAWAAGTPRLREPACAGSAEIWSGDAALPCLAAPGTRCGVYLQFLNFVTGV